MITVQEELNNDFIEYLEYTGNRKEYEVDMDSDTKRKYKEHMMQTIMFMVFHMMKETERMRNEVNKVINKFIKKNKGSL